MTDKITEVQKADSERVPQYLKFTFMQSWFPRKIEGEASIPGLSFRVRSEVKNGTATVELHEQSGSKTKCTMFLIDESDAAAALAQMCKLANERVAKIPDIQYLVTPIASQGA